MRFVAVKSTFAYLAVFAFLGVGCTQDVWYDSQIPGVNSPNSSVALPICGKLSNKNAAEIDDFPWRASLYIKSETSKGPEIIFVCDATIIQANLLLTSAQCVSDELHLTKISPEKLLVLTGNTFRHNGFVSIDAVSGRKSLVKRVHMHCGYHGLLGRWATDIAILELEEPFEFSDTLLPVCLDAAGHSEQILKPGAYGKIGVFEKRASSESSDILRTLTLPYISRDQCRSEIIAQDRRSQEFLSRDKFCAAYNGSAVCEGDRGSGLVFERNGTWYLMGIHSLVALPKPNDDDVVENREVKCDRYFRSLYTKVSLYTAWIQNVTSSLDQGESIPPCNYTTMTVQQAIAEALSL